MSFFDIEIDFYWLVILGQFLFTLIISTLIYPGLEHFSRIKNIKVIAKKNSKLSMVLSSYGIFITFLMSVIFAFVLFGSTPLPLSIRALGIPLLILFSLDLDIKDNKGSVFTKTLVLIGLVILFILISNNMAIKVQNWFGVGLVANGLSWVFMILIYFIGLNAFKVLDRVDGLVGGLAIVANLYFGIAFILIKDFHWAFISFASFGAILGFLISKIFSKQSIYLGNGGSLFVGFILITLSLNYWISPNLIISDYQEYDILTFVAVISYPLVNIVRMFLIRLRKGKSPFRASRNHLHYELVKLGLNHRQITLFILGYTILLVLLIENVDSKGIYVTLSILLFFLLLLGLSPLFLIKSEYGIRLRWPWDFQNS